MDALSERKGLLKAQYAMNVWHKSCPKSNITEINFQWAATEVDFAWFAISHRQIGYWSNE